MSAEVVHAEQPASSKLASGHSGQGLYHAAKPPVPLSFSQDPFLFNRKCLGPSEDLHVGVCVSGESHVTGLMAYEGKGLDSSWSFLVTIF